MFLPMAEPVIDGKVRNIGGSVANPCLKGMIKKQFLYDGFVRKLA